MSRALRILVVDDDWPMAKSLVDILKVKGYSAEAANSGSKALERMAEDQFDCVLTDIKMPEVNGVELFREINALRPELPVVFMTAYATGELVKEGLREGAVASLVKPLDIDLLLCFLHRLGEERSVVIVSDDPQFSRIWGQELTERGFAVTVVGNGKGLEETPRPHGQVLLVSLKAGDDTGLTALRKIRTRYAHLPVIVVADQREEIVALIEHALEPSAHTCLYEPLRTEELIQALTQIRRMELGKLLLRSPSTVLV